uniref:Uncharacterized protein n=1 Tax=Globodera rostochiensis TaxID=31243 RepID=A0A914HGV2_GLORO
MVLPWRGERAMDLTTLHGTGDSGAVPEQSGGGDFAYGTANQPSIYVPFLCLQQVNETEAGGRKKLATKKHIDE